MSHRVQGIYAVAPGSPTAAREPDFDLLAFHDAFMKLPYPISIIEGMLLGEAELAASS